jgi:hypothetical protein
MNRRVKNCYLHTLHREISNIERNAIISGIDYTSNEANSATVYEVLSAIVRQVKKYAEFKTATRPWQENISHIP